MYSHKAIETINITLKHIIEEHTESHEYLKQLRKDIHNSVKFHFDEDACPLKYKAIYTKLPFDLCYYEFECTDKQIVSVLLNQVNDNLIRGEVLQTSIAGIEPQLITLTIDNTNEKLKSFGFNSTNEIILHDEESAPKVLQYSLDRVLYFTQLIACSNITYIDNPAPKKTNERRKKKKKPPLYEYKTLELLVSDKVLNKNGSPTDEPSHSKRIHLRRGHIRRLNSGVSTWVQPCVVGSQSNGLINKDYILKQ